MKKGIDFRRMVGEFLVIVIGIVAALGVDRWVQGIDEGRAELEYLALLLADVEANSRIFEGMVSDWETAAEAAGALRTAVATGRRPSDSGLFMAVARAGTVNTAPARDGSFRDMEATGNVRLLSDHDLRSRVVGYFTQDIRFGRPIIEDRLDLRFRLFAREQVPVELHEHRSLCPSPTPSLECELDNLPSAENLWRALFEDPSMPLLLNSRHADALLGADVARSWLESTRQLQTELREE
ncbi:MAG: hypothetical protein WEA09_05645 [Gemmatimonadota bacterium]